MAKYDLSGGLETSFTFTIDGKEFEFRKPTVREMRAIAKQFSSIEKEQDQDKQLAAGDKAMATLYEYVKPVGHEVNIADLMPDQPLGVQTAFNDMIKKELGATS